MKLKREEVEHIALLARVGVTEEDVERFREQLSNILENFEVLQELDTDHVPPTAQSIPLLNVMRPDCVRPSWPADEILANAPQEEDNSFKVKAILE